MKNLIVYYSWSNNTKKLAEYIQAKSDGDIFEIEMVEAYQGNYQMVVEQAKKEIQANYQPSIKAIMDISDYDNIYIGTPNWWGTMAPPVASFISQLKCQGKHIIPFSTHGGGGAQNTLKDIKKACESAIVLDGLCVYENNLAVAFSAIDNWLLTHQK